MVIQQNSRKLLMMDILMSETCWAHKKWNKIASDINLVFYSSIVNLMVIVQNNQRYTVHVLKWCSEHVRVRRSEIIVWSIAHILLSITERFCLALARYLSNNVWAYIWAHNFSLRSVGEKIGLRTHLNTFPSPTSSPSFSASRFLIEYSVDCILTHSLHGTGTLRN